MKRSRWPTYTGTPTFRAKITDPDSGQPVGARFEWWRYGATTKMGEKATAKVAFMRVYGGVKRRFRPETSASH